MRLLSKEQLSELKSKTYENHTNEEFAEKYHITKAGIKSAAYRELMKKSPEHVSKVRSVARKGKRKKIVVMEEIEIVEQKTQWLNTFVANDIRTGKMKSPADCVSLSTLVSRWNRIQGKMKGLHICLSTDFDNCLVTATAKPI